MEICSICLKTDILCSGCKKKVESGEISEGKVNVARTLYKLVQKYPSLGNVKVVDAVEGEGVSFVLVPSSQVTKLIGKGGKTADAISEALGKRVRIMGDDDEKNIIESVLYPAKMIGVNKVFPKDGGEYLKAYVPENDLNRMALGKEEAEATISKFIKKKIEISCE